MSTIIPHPLLFRYSIPVRYVARLPKRGKSLLNLPDDCLLPNFGDLGGEQEFGRLRAAWNENGIGFSVEVCGKQKPVMCDVGRPEESDGLQVWIDTRNTQSIHRASRFCHHFCFLPAARRAGDVSPLVTTGDVKPALPAGTGAANNNAIGIQLPIARAREEAPINRPEQIQVAAQVGKDGYRLEAWLAAEQLHGFDPEANPLLGFYYYLRDAELGEQFLSVGREFPFAHDPSLWSTLELLRPE
jgi:hypothetical protein